MRAANECDSPLMAYFVFSTLLSWMNTQNKTTYTVRMCIELKNEHTCTPAWCKILQRIFGCLDKYELGKNKLLTLLTNCVQDYIGRSTDG